MFQAYQTQETIESFLRRHGLSPHSIGILPAVRFEFQGRFPVHCVVSYALEDSRLHLIAGPRLPIQGPFQNLVIEFLGRCNSQLAVGNFHFHFESYYLVFALQIPLPPDQLSTAWIRNLVMPALFELDRHLAGLAMILASGTSPRQACHAVQQADPRSSVRQLEAHFGPMFGEAELHDLCTIDQVCAALTILGLDPFVIDHQHVGFLLPIEATSLQGMVEVNDEERRLSTRIEIPGWVANADRIAVNNALVELNQHLTCGGFELLFDQGALQYRHGFYFKGEVLKIRTLRGMFQAQFAEMAGSIAALQSLI